MKLSKAAGAGSDNKRSDRLQPLFLYNVGLLAAVSDLALLLLMKSLNLNKILFSFIVALKQLL